MFPVSRQTAVPPGLAHRASAVAESQGDSEHQYLVVKPSNPICNIPDWPHILCLTKNTLVSLRRVKLPVKACNNGYQSVVWLKEAQWYQRVPVQRRHQHRYQRHPQRPQLPQPPLQALKARFLRRESSFPSLDIKMNLQFTNPKKKGQKIQL